MISLTELFYIEIPEGVEIAQWLTILAVLTEDPDLIPSTHITAHNIIELLHFQNSNAFQRHRPPCRQNTHMDKNNNSKVKKHRNS